MRFCVKLDAWPKKLIIFNFFMEYKILEKFVSDVDVPEPDEKSVITYISSLYDVFPDVPSVEETLRDNVRYKRCQFHLDTYLSSLNNME